MLVAKREDGTLISLIGQQEKNELRQLREREPFYCPVCQERVELRLGERRRWHFAHRKGNLCPYQAEAESAYHLQGKRLLFEWLTSRSEQTLLEPYLPHLKQRPDLLVHTAEQPIAFEFQCATIPSELFMKRTIFFLKSGILPIWILGGNRLKRLGENIFQLPPMDWLTLRNGNKDSFEPFLLYFCPITRKFATLTDIIPYGSSKVFARLKFHPLDSFSLMKCMQPTVSAPIQMPQNWLKVKQKWRIHAIRYRGRPYKYVQKIFGSPSLIPPAAGWPTPHCYSIETPCFLWQSWLFHRFVTTWQNHYPISLHVVHEAFQNLVTKGIFQVRYFPLVDGLNERIALHEFLQCLTQLGYLRQIGKEQFLKKTTCLRVETVEDIRRLDLKYFEKLSQII